MFPFKSILPFVLCLSLQSLAWANATDLTQLLLSYITQANSWVEAVEKGEYVSLISGESHEDNPPARMGAAMDKVCINPNEPFTDIIPGVYRQEAYNMAIHQGQLAFRNARALLQSQQKALGEALPSNPHLQNAMATHAAAFEELYQQSVETLIEEEAGYEATFKARGFPRPRQPLTYATVGGLRAFIVFGSLGYEFTDLVVFDQDPRVCAYNAIEALLLAISTSVEDYRSLHLDAPIEAWESRLQAHNIAVDDLILKRLYAFQRVAIVYGYCGKYNLAGLFFDADDQDLWKSVRYSFRKRPYERLRRAAKEGRMQFVQESVGPNMPQFFKALRHAYNVRGARLGLLDFTNIVRLKQLWMWEHPAVTLAFHPLDAMEWATPKNCFGFIHALAELLDSESAVRPDDWHAEPIVLPSTVLIGTDHYCSEVDKGLLLRPFALPLFSLLLEAQPPDWAGAYARPSSEGSSVEELVKKLGKGVQTRFHWGLPDLPYPLYQHTLKALESRYAKINAIDERVYGTSLQFHWPQDNQRQMERAANADVAYQVALRRSQGSSLNALPPSVPILLNPVVPQNRTQGRSPLSEEDLAAKKRCEVLMAKMKAQFSHLGVFDDDLFGGRLPFPSWGGSATQ